MSTSEVQEEGYQDEEEQHVESLDNFSEPDRDFEEWGPEAPIVLEGQGTEAPVVLEGQCTKDRVLNPLRNWKNRVLKSMRN